MIGSVTKIPLVENVWIHYYISMPYFPARVKHIPTKRIFDLLFSSAALIVLMPFLLILALFVAGSTKSSPIYRHRRIGRGGRPFTCYKFRSMRRGADRQLAEILERDPLLKEEWERTRKLKRDPRVTRLGRFLRKSSLDELPQFINVLKGDLSVVGPRAVEMVEIENHFGPAAEKILTIRPGLTGLWQVSGRSNTSYRKRIRFDETYVERRSLLLDLRIVLKTIPLLFNGRGAY